jgi:phosphoesterase RecJ-like protein
MIQQSKILQLKKIIDSVKNIAIFWHEYIDGDCIWSMLWLGYILEKIGKKVSYFTPIATEKIFDFVPWIKKISTDFDPNIQYDVIIFVDFTPYNRISWFTKNNKEYFDQATKIVIDHHEDDQIWWNLEIKDTSASSNCEWIFEIMQKIYPEHLDKYVATLLYLWLTTDTWNFVFEKNSMRTMNNALWLIKLWADKSLIIDNIIRKKSLTSVRFMSTIFQRIGIDKNVLFSYFEEQERENLWLSKEEAEYGLFILQSIDWPAICAFIRTDGKIIKISLRSKWSVNVQKIAAQLWWWWHVNAAWLTIPFDKNISFEQQRKDILEKINNLYDQQLNQ